MKVESKYMNYHMKYLVPIMKPKNCNIYSMIYVGIDFWTSSITIDKCLSSTCLWFLKMLITLWRSTKVQGWMPKLDFMWTTIVFKLF